MSMEKKTYLKLQLKRAFKIYPAVLAITVVTVFAVALTAAMLIHQSMNDEDSRKVKVGLVGDTKDTYLDIGITALQNLDSSRLSIEFIEMDEDTAKKELKEKKLSGYVFVPDNFVSAVAHGENPTAKYIMLNGPEGFGTVLTSEITQTVSGLITDAQSAMSGMSEIAENYGVNEKMSKKVKAMTFKYAEQLLKRDKSYTMVLLGIEDSLTMGGYYICGIIMFFLLLWGISCNKILIKKNYGVSQALFLRGMKISYQVLCEYLSFFAVTLTTFILLSAAFGVVVSYSDFGILELMGTGFSDCIGYIFKIIPVIIMITFMQMMLYEVVSGTVNGVLLQFMVAVVFSYISGCFYPNFFFPESVRSFAAVLPSGVGFSYLRKCLAGISCGGEFFVICLYTVVFAVITVMVRKYRMAGDKI